MLDQQIVDSEPAAPPRRRRGLRRAILAVGLLIVLLVVGVVAGYGAFLNHEVTSNVRHASLLPAPGAASGSSDHGSGAAARRGLTGQSTRGENILLIGSDARAGLAGGRSDAIILVHVSSDRRRIYLVGFPRDLYVNIPGHGQNKINAAYAFGGAPLLVETVQQLVGVHIEHAAELGFQGFKGMTDALGGVDVYAEQPSTEGGVLIHQGINHLNGSESLTFVRERHQLSEGDISRGRRQMAFVKAVVSKIASRSTLTNPVRLAQTVAAGSQYLTLDQQFSIGDLRSLAFSLRNIRTSDVVMITAPFNGFATTSTGASIDVVNDAGMARLGSDIAADTLQKYPSGLQVP